MYFTTPSNTQVYSPFGSYVVERHAIGDERQAAQFEMAYVPPQRNRCIPLSLRGFVWRSNEAEAKAPPHCHICRC